MDLYLVGQWVFPGFGSAGVKDILANENFKAEGIDLKKEFTEYFNHSSKMRQAVDVHNRLPK